MKISNMDKHKVLAKVQEMNIEQFMLLDKNFFQPRHWGSAVLTGFSSGKPVLVTYSLLHSQIRMYALRNGKWLNFMIPIDDHLLEFIPLMTNGANSIREILNKFYSLSNGLSV